MNELKITQIHSMMLDLKTGEKHTCLAAVEGASGVSVLLKITLEEATSLCALAGSPLPFKRLVAESAPYEPTGMLITNPIREPEASGPSARAVLESMQQDSKPRAQSVAAQKSAEWDDPESGVAGV